MLFILILSVIFYLCGALLMTLPYWYETANTPCDDVPRLPYTLRNVLRLWLESARAGIFLVIAIIAAPVMSRISPGKSENATSEALPPVILIHGLYHNASAWTFLRPHLHKAGFTRLHPVAYSSRKASINSIVASLEQAIRDIEATYPGEKPLAIGHSLGGLILRIWMAEGNNRARLSGVISLGTPHRGSKAAALALGELGRTLVPSNPLFAELVHMEKQVEIPCLALISEGDNMVLPQANLVPATPGWNMRLTPFTTHTGLLSKPQVLRLVAWELFCMADTPRTTATEQPATPEAVPPANVPPTPEEQSTHMEEKTSSAVLPVAETQTIPVAKKTPSPAPARKKRPAVEQQASSPPKKTASATRSTTKASGSKKESPKAKTAQTGKKTDKKP